MFNMRKTYLFLLVLTTGWGCSKTTLDAGLDGTWQLTDIYHGYANGGSAQWQPVNDLLPVLLKFEPNGRFQRTDSASRASCTGTYQFLPGNALGFTSRCNSVQERFQVLGIAPAELVLGQQGTEGSIRYRYQRIR